MQRWDRRDPQKEARTPLRLCVCDSHDTNKDGMGLSLVGSS